MIKGWTNIEGLARMTRRAVIGWNDLLNSLEESEDAAAEAARAKRNER